MGRAFTDAFCARDIAEPLLSFDARTSCEEVKAVLKSRSVGVAGVQLNGRVTRYVLAEELNSGSLDSVARDFVDVEVMPGSAGLIEVVRASIERPYVFVRSFGAIGGVVSDDDLQKAPVRMWLFGLVTLIEQRMLDSIVERFPDDSWTTGISPGRVEKTRELLGERQRNGFNPRLVDCLQFGDKAKILCGDETLRKTLGIRSVRQGQATFRSFESLRNNLAHAQQITVADWTFVSWLIEWIEYLLAMLARDPRAAEIRERLLGLEGDE